MRRFSSEGNLLDLDFLPWKKVALKKSDNQKNRESGTYTPHVDGDELDGGSTGPIIQEPRANPDGVGKNELSREHSISVENLYEKGKLDKTHLGVCLISETFRAYSDSQLAPDAKGSTENIERGDMTPTSPSTNPFNFKSHRQQKPKVSSAKLNLRSLFGQSPHSSNSNLSDQKDSATERRSRLLFMRQWSQVGHNRKAGVSVFGAFLRSEFSEENLQFYLACEQYRQSSTNFTLQRRAKDICVTYVQPGSPREVNLDSKTRDLTIQLLQAPSRTSLLHAQKRIYSLLDTDCYPRFLQSYIYLSLLREAD
ncbi:Regulator of G-protein signaling 1 [Nibea albiflora]|uniref:Regulator of G-protein signaling 1 n=1 Tax=Nibea albiflora TaxID=240163 RepID=A0ACB7ERX2_NIBAL|nr:Regulator of G-protein signaling 1 [Nibea albiflora]